MKKFIAIALVFILAVAFPITALADESHHRPGFPDSGIEDATITDHVDPDNVEVFYVQINPSPEPEPPDWNDFIIDGEELDDAGLEAARAAYEAAHAAYQKEHEQWRRAINPVDNPDITVNQISPDEAQEIIENYLKPFILNEAWIWGVSPEDQAVIAELDDAWNAVWVALYDDQITPEEAAAQLDALQKQYDAIGERLIGVGTINQITQIGSIQLKEVDAGFSYGGILFQLDGVDPWDIVWVYRWMDAAGEYAQELVQAWWNDEAEAWDIWVQDIHLLSLFFALIERGVPPAEAARTVLSETTGTSPTTYDHGTNAGFILLGVLLFGAAGVFAAKKARQYN